VGELGEEDWAEFEVGLNYTQASLEFAIEATQRTVEQFFAFRQSLDKVVEDSFKRNQALIGQSRARPSMSLMPSRLSLRLLRNG
jgi:hypothetical protein